MDFITAKSHDFVLQKTKQAFLVRGFNYDRDYKMRLIEEYWDSEWQTVVSDFKEMKALGANVVRIHLQFPKFMDSAGKANAHSLQQLQRLLKLAEDTGLYLDLTGLACYRKADVPRWFDQMTEKERWKVQANFWRAIAKTCKKSPAVFCYDLINEPIVPETKFDHWLVGELAGFYYVQAVALERGQRDRSSVGLAWTKQMVAAIHKEDKKHLITIGLLPESGNSPSGSGFPPAELARYLDFIAVHLYPNSKHLAEDRAQLRKFAVGKPLVIEEIYPLAASGNEVKAFLEDSQAVANGWIGFYWGQTEDELHDSGEIRDVFTLEWLRIFRELNNESHSNDPKNPR